MSEEKIYECGGEQKAEKIKALKEIAKGSLAMAAGGVLYHAGFAMGSSAGDGYLGGAVAMTGIGAVLGGAAVAGRGVIRFVDNSPKLKKALIFGYKNAEKAANKMHSFVKAKVAPFVKKAIENVNTNTKSLSDKVKMESIPFEAYKHNENGEAELVHSNTAAKFNAFMSKLKRER